MAEARAMSASRSKVSSDHSDDGYLEDHSQITQNEEYRNGTARPISGVRTQQTTDMPRRQSAGLASQSRPAQKSVTYEDMPTSSGNSGSGGGGSNGDLAKRVVMLEDQIRLLKQQNRIFLSFMQNTEQQLADLRASQSQSHSQPQSQQSDRGRSRVADPSPSARGNAQPGSYPNNMSQGTKQVLQRSQSERQTQPPPSSSSSRQQASSPSLNGRSFAPPPARDPNEVDQTFAPLDPTDEREREKERLRSAKKKAGLLNLREKMAQKAASAAQAQPDESRGRGYQAGAYQDYDDPPSAQGGYVGGGSQPSARNPPNSYQQQSQQGGARSAAPTSARAQPAPAVRRPAQPSYDEYGDDGPNDSFSGGGGGGMGAAGVPEGADEEVETFPCPNCDRRFNSLALSKHVAKQLCKQKPRKVFNMAQKRLEDLAQEAREAGIKLPTKPVAGQAGAAAPPAAAASKRPQDQPLKKQSKWRAEHEKFMAAIQAGKQLQAAMASGIPLSSLPPPVTREEDDDRTPCPHWYTAIADTHTATRRGVTPDRQLTVTPFPILLFLSVDASSPPTSPIESVATLAWLLVCVVCVCHVESNLTLLFCPSPLPPRSTSPTVRTQRTSRRRMSQVRHDWETPQTLRGDSDRTTRRTTPYRLHSVHADARLVHSRCVPSPSLSVSAPHPIYAPSSCVPLPCVSVCSLLLLFGCFVGCRSSFVVG